MRVLKCWKSYTIDAMEKALTLAESSKEFPDERRTTAIGLARYAYEYLQAAIVVEEHATVLVPGSQIAPMPAYFLLTHGIELTLKAFLLHKSFTVKQLSGKELGHDLLACYGAAKLAGLPLIFDDIPMDETAMDMLIGLNKNQGVRYIKTGMKHFPLWPVVLSMAVRLHQAVAPLIGYKSFPKTFSGYQ